MGWEGSLAMSSGVHTFWQSTAGLVVSAGGLLLIVGLLTAFAGAIAMPAFAGLALRAGQLHDVHATLMLVNCAVLALIGPGSLSIDAQLFGRREIVIQRRPTETPVRFHNDGGSR